VSTWSFRPSWRISLGFDRLDDGGCVIDCLHFQISGGPGLAVNADLGIDMTLYGFIDAQAGLGGVFRDWYRVGMGASSGVIFNFGPFGRLQGEASYFYPFAGVERPGFVPGPDDGPEFRLTAAQSIFLSKDFELRGRITRGRAYTEGLGSLHLYF
jgi:hypothetical protein